MTDVLKESLLACSKLLTITFHYIFYILTFYLLQLVFLLRLKQGIQNEHGKYIFVPVDKAADSVVMN